MNKKTFLLALAFFCVALAGLGLAVYKRMTHPAYVGWFDLLIAVLFVAAGAAMTVHEFRKKKRIHLDEADKHQIP